jgi:hypothetical protein
MPEPKNAKDKGERPEPEHRASRSRRRGEPSRESVRDRDRSRDDDGEGNTPDEREANSGTFLKVRGARWLGSEPPTAEAYARALAQWRQLPGAIGVTAADLGGAANAAKLLGAGAGGEEVP